MLFVLSERHRFKGTKCTIWKVLNKHTHTTKIPSGFKYYRKNKVEIEREIYESTCINEDSSIYRFKTVS